MSATTNTYHASEAQAYAKRGYDGTYYLISRCLDGYFSAHWAKENIANAHVLDYGSGTGTSAAFLKSFGFQHILGIDPSESMVQLAKELDSQTDFRLLLPKFNWSELAGKYDVIFSSFVIPVLPTAEDISIYLNNAGCSLKDNGVLILVTASPEAFNPNHKWVSWEQDFPENYSAKNGDKVRVRIKQGDLILNDILWTSIFLEDMFESHHFKQVHAFKPLGYHEDPFQWNSETIASPFDIYVLKRHPQSAGGNGS